ncbi:partial putative ABC transporter ATP-binding protein YheS, partial [uncultured bacterium]
ADTLYLVADQGCKVFDGDLDDYANWLAESRVVEAAPDTAKLQRKEARAAEEKSRQEKLAQRRPLMKELEKLEKNLASWQGEKTLLETRLGDPALYTTPDRALLESLQKRQAELSGDIETAELRWLEIHELLEA